MSRVGSHTVVFKIYSSGKYLLRTYSWALVCAQGSLMEKFRDHMWGQMAMMEANTALIPVLSLSPVPQPRINTLIIFSFNSLLFQVVSAYMWPHLASSPPFPLMLLDSSSPKMKDFLFTSFKRIRHSDSLQP